jgi:uncharacterized protein YjdB
MKFKNTNRLVLTLFFSCFALWANAQLVNCNVFLQGNYIEVGINLTGAFGTSEPAPVGYHPRPGGSGNLQNTCTSTCTGTTRGLGFVADPDKDGWTVGSPGYYGDYFVPGSPQEGWSIKTNGHNSNAWNINGACGTAVLYTGGLTGNNLSYSSTGSVISGTWQGINTDSIQITQVTSLDTANVFFTVRVTLKNTGRLTKNNVYYMRTVDPDNDQTLPGGGFATNNSIVYQLPNTLGATLVSAVGQVYSGAYLGLGTLDCRAKCFIVNGGTTLTPPHGADSMYNQLGGGALYTGTLNADDAIGLAFQLGNINSGDSVIFSYAYVLKASDLLVALNSTGATWTARSDTAASAHISKDTAHVCSGASTTINISNPESLSWTWYSLTGETLTSYTGTTTSVITGSTLINLLAIANTACGGPDDTLYINIDPSLPIPVTPTAGSNSPLCAGSTLNLTASTPTSGVSYAWTGPSGFTSTLQNPSIAGATSAASGVYSVVATAGNCSSGTATTTVTVNSIASPVTPSVTAVCTGNTVSLSVGASGGAWTATNTNATVSSSGLVTGVTAGIDTIRYTLGTCLSEATVNVLASAPISPLTSSVCVGSGVILTDAAGGGVWSANNTNATVVGGVVTGVAVGVDTINYTIFFGPTVVCNNTATVNVLNAPSTILPATPVNICLGSTASLSDGIAGGVWSSGAPGIATVGSTGIVTGIGLGTAVISYSIGTCVATKTVTVVNAPSAISPLSIAICQGATTNLTDLVLGGVWSSSNGSIASIGTSGTVTGVAPGNVTITYAIGTCTTTSTVTVNTTPVAISPGTPVSVCLGGTTVLTDATPGGVWSSSNGAIATVIGGTVTGAGVGTANISYTLGSCAVGKAVTVVSAPAAISPISTSVCVGATTNLSNAVGGGTWTSSNGTIATIGSTSGTVSGVAPGSVTITYAIGSCTTTSTVTVNANPSAISPPGAVSICVGSTTTLTDVGGGTWISGNTSVATVGSATGIVTGLSAGTVNISFVNASGCVAIKPATVAITPAAIAPATANVCLGSTTTLTNAVGGGTWTSGNTGVATIGSSSGTVTGVGAGSATITYAIGSCTAISTVSVSPAASAGSISGASSICAGGTATFTDPAPGGSWSSSNIAIAAVGSGTGIVMGVGAGTATISYSVSNSCGVVSATKTVNVVAAGIGAITGPVTLCAGTFATLSDVTAGGTWSASNSHATITGTGLLTGISAGIDTITYTATNVCGTFSATRIENIGAFLSAGTIFGPSAVCAPSTITLTDPATGGTWSVTNSHASVSGSGVVTGLTAGLDTVMYTETAVCGTAVATHVVTVSILPVAGGIVGAATTCAGILTAYSNAVTGGTWSLSNIIIATISGTGVLSPVTPGIDTIKYTVSNTCGTAIATKVVTIGPYLTAGSISGLSVVCAGSAITLTDPVPGGLWSTSNASASVTGGTVMGIVGGVDSIMYSVSSSCGTAVATHVVTVNPLPDAGTITGPSNICTGTVTLYTDGSPGGIWSMSNAHATVTSGGLVTAVSPGIDTIIYTVTNSCGTAVTNMPVTIGATLTASTITGPGNVCIGATITLSDASAGGTWTSSNTSVGTIGSTGLVMGLSSGTTIISYTVTSRCGTATATTVVTVSPVAVVGAISGPSSMCTGTFTIFSDPVPGGVWSSSNATATVSIGGVVTAISAGTDTIMYTVNTGCSSAVASKVVTIAPGAGAGTITGPASVCTGATIALADATPGGTWSTSNVSATVGSTGIVTGITPGVDTIMYSITSSCGLAAAAHIVTVISSGTVSAITGPSNVCVGSLILLSDATPGGAWSSSNTHATITTAGVVTGITPGTDTISYTIVGSCGLSAATKVITIGSSVTAGPITGPSTVCEGTNITLVDAVGGGIWSSSNGHASIGSATGIVTGLSAGVDTIIYTLSGSCGGSSVTAVITVLPAPNAGTISGPDSVCLSSSITLTDLAPGGVWSAGNANATVVSGIVTGVSAGSDPISYSVTNSCGTASAVKIVMVTAVPAAGLITGPSSVCVGSGITLVDAVPGGTWLASNAHAMVAGPGIIDGITVGTDTIFYVITNLCGTSTTSKIIAVNPVPVVGPISGPTSQCLGTTVSMTDPVSGGIWTSSNPAVATIGISSGMALGVSVGTTTITYTVTNLLGCPTSVTISDTVVITPVTPAITGSANVCVGTTTPLANAASGGTWTSANPSIASVGAATGIVSGIALGTTTITYTITNICGTASVTQSETVNPMPVVAAISGATSVCQGATTTLADATTGGIWSSNNPSIATVGSATGMVSGVTPGTTTINYTYASTAGCTIIVSIPDTVVAAPVVAAITGTMNECIGLTTTLSSTTAAGTWSSANPSVAAVGSTSGVVTGVAGGITTISYSVSNMLGCSTTVTASDTVNTPPVVAAISGPVNVCVGANITLTDATAGGAWNAANANATVVAGVVTGVTAGTDMISYTMSNGCGSTSATSMVTIDPLTTAGTITGSSNVCVGATITLADATTGGVWNATNPNAAVGSTGIVTGIATGVDTIVYTVTGMCGIAATTQIVTIGILPTVNAISGAATVCKSAAITLTDATLGGTWSSVNTKATVGSSSGIVTGVTAGVDTIVYTVSNACGSVSSSKVVTITQAPSAGIISGTSDVCPGATISLSAIGGSPTGTWSSSNGAVATVSSTGLVTGVATGTATISYTVSNSCGSRSASHTVTVMSPADCNTGINTTAKVNDELTVYPNPNKGIFTIELTAENDEEVNVVITNIIGKKVKEFAMTTNKATNVHLTVTPGIYLLTANTARGVKYVTKLTVQ